MAQLRNIDVQLAEELGFDPETITVHWFRGDEFMIAVFDGLDPDVSEYLCPGSSIFDGSGWVHISNAPAPGSDCSEGETHGITFAESVAGVSGAQVCDGVVSQITAIPNDTDGELFASVELYPPGGVFYGATASIQALARRLSPGSSGK